MPVERAFVDPATLPIREVGELHGESLQARRTLAMKIRIQARKLLQYNPHGPLVEDDVMDREEQDIAVPSNLVEHRARQRASGNIEGTGPQFLCPGSRLGERVRFGEIAQVLVQERRVTIRAKLCNDRITRADEVRPQAFVPSMDLIQRTR